MVVVNSWLDDANESDMCRGGSDAGWEPSAADLEKAAPSRHLRNTFIDLESPSPVFKNCKNEQFISSLKTFSEELKNRVVKPTDRDNVKLKVRANKRRHTMQLTASSVAILNDDSSSEESDATDATNEATIARDFATLNLRRKESERGNRCYENEEVNFPASSLCRNMLKSVYSDKTSELSVSSVFSSESEDGFTSAYLCDHPSVFDAEPASGIDISIRRLGADCTEEEEAQSASTSGGVFLALPTLRRNSRCSALDIEQANEAMLMGQGETSFPSAERITSALTEASVPECFAATVGLLSSDKESANLSLPRFASLASREDTSTGFTPVASLYAPDPSFEPRKSRLTGPPPQMTGRSDNMYARNEIRGLSNLPLPELPLRLPAKQLQHGYNGYNNRSWSNKPNPYNLGPGQTLYTAKPRPVPPPDIYGYRHAGWGEGPNQEPTSPFPLYPQGDNGNSYNLQSGYPRYDTPVSTRSGLSRSGNSDNPGSHFSPNGMTMSGYDIPTNKFIDTMNGQERPSVPSQPTARLNLWRLISEELPLSDHRSEKWQTKEELQLMARNENYIPEMLKLKPDLCTPDPSKIHIYNLTNFLDELNLHHRPNMNVLFLSSRVDTLPCTLPKDHSSSQSEECSNDRADSTTLLTASTDHPGVHPTTCKPCAFFWTKGCANGNNCKFCHEWHGGKKKKKPLKDQHKLMILCRPDGKVEFLRCTIGEAT